MNIFVRQTTKAWGVYLNIGINRATVIHDGSKDECNHVVSHIKPLMEDTTINFAMFDLVEPKLKGRTIDVDHHGDLSVIYFLDSVTGERHLSYIWDESEHTLYGFRID